MIFVLICDDRIFTFGTEKQVSIQSRLTDVSLLNVTIIQPLVGSVPNIILHRIWGNYIKICHESFDTHCQSSL